MKHFSTLLLIFCLPLILLGQKKEFSRADSLRGTLNQYRSCYDVTFYDLEVDVDIAGQKIAGSNTIHFEAQEPFRRLQIDLFANMQVDRIAWKDEELSFDREANAVFVDFPVLIAKQSEEKIKIEFSGTPRKAKNAPWDGGFVWSMDENNKPWVGVACEGIGASLWWPLKDHLSDEPDSMRITLVSPDSLVAVANGHLRSEKVFDNGKKASEWFVSYPINSYNVTVNIGDYVHMRDTFHNATGVQELDYYVLPYNKPKAEKQFTQVKPMLKVFEKYFGAYPFWKDGYALVETPYLGMEHQGAIAYGNRYLPGYAGYDPLNLKFDYIIIHESGHEWWGNSVSCQDHAELWIHESFCTYSEAVYVEELWGKETAEKYLISQVSSIANASPIVGPLGVNFDNWRGSDMYYKGSWMLHSLRYAVNDDKLWWQTILDFATEFRIKNTNTVEIIDWFNKKLGKDYTAIFRQYLYHAPVPILEYKVKKSGKNKVKFSYRWDANESDFDMPLRVETASGLMELHPNAEWQTEKIEASIKDFKLPRRKFLARFNKK